MALLLAPIGLVLLIARPRWRDGLSQRLGGASAPRSGAVWLHAASVGEVQAAAPLVASLKRQGREVVVSVTTTSGRDALRSAHPEWACMLAPLDHPWIVARALAKVEPSLLVFVETELWPCWIAAAQRASIPVAVVSATISERSFERYRLSRVWMGATFRRLDAVAARTRVDAERFISLGTPRERVEVTGDLKLLAARDSAVLADEVVRALHAVPIFVAGSTHESEERAALGVLASARERGLAVALVLAPRHVERCDAIERELNDAGHDVLRRSRLKDEVLAPGQVLLLDTLGELQAIYAHACVAFVGGSLAPVGGHNLFEPLAAGCPVLFGPHVENVRHQVELLRESGSGRQVVDALALAENAIEMLEDPASARALGRRGRERFEARAQSEAEVVSILERLLERGGAGGGGT